MTQKPTDTKDQASSFPLEYQQGFFYFHGLRFTIYQRAYVSNQETEQLVDLLLADLPQKTSVVDVGTGCGSIAISIKKERSDVPVQAVDIRAEALALALQNACHHGVSIDFFVSNYVDHPALQEPTHIIADLPWGDESTILDSSGGMPRLAHMPQIALFHRAGILGAYGSVLNVG